MPYITKDRRVQFNKALTQIEKIEKKGDLEYCIYFLMMRYMRDKEKNYSNHHDTTYAAHHCGDEYRRRYLDKREDVAIEKNGDITGE